MECQEDNTPKVCTLLCEKQSIQSGKLLMHTGCNCVSFGIIPGSVQEISSAVFQYASASLRNQIKNLLYVY